MASRSINSIAVFCGSNFGFSEDYAAAARALGSVIATKQIVLIYGGTTKGLMGVLADETLKMKGVVHGVVTERLHNLGQSHAGLFKHETTNNLRSRKERMIELADAFIILPGGIGTIEELMEVWSMNQLREIDKPIGLLDIKGFFSNFLHFIDHMIESGFLPIEHRESVSIDPDPLQLIKKLSEYKSIQIPKWVDVAK